MSDKKRVDVDALLASVDLVALIDSYVPLTKAGKEYEACCPFHTEKSPSFKVNPVKGIYHCFGCGANGDAIGFLRAYKGISFLDAVAELGGESPSAGGPVAAPVKAPARVEEKSPWVPVLPATLDAPEPPKAHYKRGQPQRVWCYRDAQGQVLGFVYRFTKSDGGKDILPLVWARNESTGEQEWNWMQFPAPNRPLYGLDRLAAKPDATVLLVEGEKCADAAHEELPELAVVSWPGGGKADGKVDWLPLAGRKVITWADADAKREKLTREEEAAGVSQESKPLLPEAMQPGAQTMERIRQRLAAMGCRLWNVKLPPPGAKPDGWDVADAVIEGLKGKELAEFVRECARSVVPLPQSQQPEHSAPKQESSGTGGKQAAQEKSKKRAEEPLLVDADDWLNAATPMEWVVDGLIQRGDLYAMTAITNHGKTAIGLNLALCIAAGRKFAGRDIKPGKVMILCGENPHGFRTRLRATLEAMGLEREDVKGRITVLPRALPIGSAVEQVIEEARRIGGEYSLVLVDTSVSYFSGDNEDDNLQARTHAWHLRALSEIPGNPAVIANTHPTKNAERESLLPRGGGAFLNEIDTNLTVFAEGETATLHWHRKKRGPDFDPIPFEFHGKSVEEHGVKVPTVVALHITEQREQELVKKRSEEENRLMFAMLHHPDAGFRGWVNHCGWSGESGRSGLSKVTRVLDRLKPDKLVEKYRNKWQLTERGKKEAQYIQ